MGVHDRELDKTALFKAACKLEACVQAWGEAGIGPQLDEALRYNLRLWTLFQCELAQPAHEVLPGLRRDLLRLSAVVDRRTFEIMADPELGKLQSLIDINRSIAMGPSALSPGMSA